MRASAQTARRNVRLHDLYPPLSNLRQEVLEGLRRSPPAIAPKFFYDARGSELFDAICRSPEYYPTRTEIGILTAHADEMASLLGEGCLLVELGSGSSQKIRLLLEALRPAIYMPLDISRQHLWQSASALATDYPWLSVHAVCTDYSRSLNLPQRPNHLRTVAFFPGSSVGNFEPERAVNLLQRVHELVRPNGALLIGVDLKKDRSVLDAAYNDAQGITAAFNLNLLRRINRELGADFDLEGFRHSAFYSAELGRIEMHLVSLRHQVVNLDGSRFAFAPGQGIHTENSYKYAVEEFQQLARRAGFQPGPVWQDAHRLFSVHLLRA